MTPEDIEKLVRMVATETALAVVAAIVEAVDQVAPLRTEAARPTRRRTRKAGRSTARIPLGSTHSPEVKKRRSSAPRMTPRIASGIKYLHKTTDKTQQEIAAIFRVNQGRVSEVLTGTKYRAVRPVRPRL